MEPLCVRHLNPATAYHRFAMIKPDFIVKAQLWRSVHILISRL